MRASKLLTLMGLLGLIPIQGRTEDLDIRGDVRCLVVGMRFTALSDATYKSAGMILSMYYFGRLDAHVPKLDIENLIVKEVTTMTPPDYSSEAMRGHFDGQGSGNDANRQGPH
jgi:hypothetical protein